MSWILFGNGIVAAAFLCALAAICFWGLRALGRKPVAFLVAFAILSVVATIKAQKTNGVFKTGLSGARSRVPLSQNPVNPVNPVKNNLPVQTTSDDIARGWRVESVITNAAVSYAMPTNATLVGNWHVHGAASSFGNNRIDFGDWRFPLGTNDATFSSFWYFIDGRIRPTPRDAAHEICAVGVPMYAVPGRSRLWTAEEPDGARVLTWENFFLGGDTNAPVNAQIRLYPNGDFTTRSNEVKTAYRRVNPDDWDGDGIANDIDANPLFCDGDFYGVANALPSNANPNAYYWLGLCATGALGVATIRVTCDGPSDLGDHCVIALTNQVCYIPLLAGATYAVESDLPIDDAAVSSEYAEIATNSETSLTVSLPIELSFERVQTRGGSDNYIAHTTPIDVGPRIVDISGGCCSCVTNDLGFSWDCFPQCVCGGSGHSLSCAAEWEMGFSCCIIFLH